MPIPYRLNPLGIAPVSGPMPLTLTAVTAATVELRATGSPSVDRLHYRSGLKGEWLSYIPGTVLSVCAGESVQFWNSNTGLSNSGSSYAQFYLTGQLQGKGDCMSLINYASQIAYQAFRRLFNGCSGLVTAPKISSGKVSTACFYSMFQGCGFATAPRIFATSLVNSCCRDMFRDCQQLDRIEVDFTDWADSANATLNWVSNVAASGTFIKPAALPEEYGTSRIPEGWTVINK